MNVSNLAECRAIGRASAARREPPSFSRSRMVVKAVKGALLDLDGGTTALPMRLSGVPMTTACSGVRAGDVVIVDIYMHQPLVIGVIAR